MAKRKPQKPTDDLAAVNDLVVKLVKRELEFFDVSGERVPAALLSTATALLKSYSVPDDARDAAVVEEAQESTLTFKSRLAPEWVERLLGRGFADDFAGITAEDYVNIAQRARYLMKTQPDHPDSVKLAQIAEQAEEQQQQQQQSEAPSAAE